MESRVRQSARDEAGLSAELNPREAVLTCPYHEISLPGLTIHAVSGRDCPLHYFYPGSSLSYARSLHRMVLTSLVLQARAAGANKPGGKLANDLAKQKKQTQNQTLVAGSEQERRARDVDQTAQAQQYN